MLIVTRRAGESVCIGDDIRVIIVSLKGNQVRIGIEAPSEVPVLREELTHPKRTALLELGSHCKS